MRRSRLFRSIVVFGSALPLDGMALATSVLALPACSDSDSDSSSDPDASWPYIWDAAPPPDAIPGDPDASPDASWPYIWDAAPPPDAEPADATPEKK